VASFYHVFPTAKPKAETQNPEPQNSKANPEHIMTLVMVQFPDNATKIDEGYLALNRGIFDPSR